MFCLNSKCNSVFYFIYINSYWRIISQRIIFFDDITQNVLLHVGADSKIFIFVWLFYIFPFIFYDKATCFSHLLKFIFSERFSNSLWGSEVLLFSKCINIVSNFVLYLYWIIVLLYTFLVILFTWYKEYMIF